MTEKWRELSQQWGHSFHLQNQDPNSEPQVFKPCRDGASKALHKQQIIMLVTEKKKKLLWSYFSKFSHLKTLSWKRSKGKTLSSTVAENSEVYLIYIHFSWEMISRFANSVCIWSCLMFHGLAVGLSVTQAFTAKQNEPRGWSPSYSTGSRQSQAAKAGQPGPSLCPHPDGILCTTPWAGPHHWPGPWHWPHHPLPASHRQASLPLLVRNVYSLQVYSPTCTQPHVWDASHSVVSDSLWLLGLYGLWNSPGQNTGLGSLSLLQGIFPTQGLNQGLLHYRQILYQLSHKGSPTCTQSQGAHSPIGNDLFAHLGHEPKILSFIDPGLQKGTLLLKEELGENTKLKRKKEKKTMKRKRGGRDCNSPREKTRGHKHKSTHSWWVDEPVSAVELREPWATSETDARLPWKLRGKESACRRRRQGSVPSTGDLTRHGAAKPGCHGPRACAPEGRGAQCWAPGACAPKPEQPPQGDACTPPLESSPTSRESARTATKTQQSQMQINEILKNRHQLSKHPVTS